MCLVSHTPVYVGGGEFGDGELFATSIQIRGTAKVTQKGISGCWKGVLPNAVSNNSILHGFSQHPSLLCSSLEQLQVHWEMCIMPGLICWLISSQWFVLSPDGQLKFTTGRTVSCWQTAEGLKLQAVTEGLSFALFSPPLLLYFSLSLALFKAAGFIRRKV